MARRDTSHWLSLLCCMLLLPLHPEGVEDLDFGLKSIINSYAPPNSSGFYSENMPVINIAGPLALDCCSKYRVLGMQKRRSYELFFEWLHKERGGITINGVKHRVVLTLFDDRSSADRVTKITKHLLYDRGIKLILGPYSSGLAKVMSNIVNQTDAVMMAPAALDSSVYIGKPRIFGIYPPAATVMESSFKTLAGKALTVASFYEDASFTRGVCGVVKAKAAKYNMNVLGEYQVTADADSDEMAKIVTKMVNSKPDFIVGCTYFNVCTRFLEEARKQQYAPKAITFTVCVSHPDFLPTLGEAGRYVLGAVPWTTDLPIADVDGSGWSSSEFNKRFTSRYGVSTTPYQAVAAWAAVLSFTSAIEQAGSTDPGKVAEALRKQSMKSMWGNIAFDANGQLSVGYKVIQVPRLGTKLDLVAPVADANAKVVYPMPSWIERECLKSLKAGSLYGMINGACSVCPMGKVSTIPNVSAPLGPNNTRMCQACPLGRSPTQVSASIFFCTVCDSGKYSAVSGASSCTACQKGRYQNESATTECALCPKGRAANADGVVMCGECPHGYHADKDGTVKCTSCAPGKFQNVSGSTQCWKCPAGTAAAQSGTYQCKQCEGGKFLSAADTDSTTCKLCVAGKYSVPGSTKCESCVPGRFAERSGLQACSECDLGRFVSINQATKCLRCPQNQYQDIKGQSTCKACAGELQTEFIASESQDECTCPPAHFRPSAHPGTSCVKCMRGLTCEGWNATPVVEPGFMVMLGAKDLPSQIDVYACKNGKLCPGVRALPRLGDWSAICGLGHVGIACDVCSTDYFYANSGQCLSCKDGAVINFPPVVEVFLFVGIVVATVNFVYIRFNMPASVLDLAWGMALKFVQNLAVLDKYQISWPDVVKNLLKGTQHVRLNLDFVGVPRWGCIIGFSFAARYLQAMLYPLLIFGIFIACWFCSRTLHKMVPPEKKHHAHLEHTMTVLEPPKRASEKLKHHVTAAISHAGVYSLMMTIVKCRLPPNPMDWNRVFNAICKIVNGLYITLTGLAIALFNCTEHPSGMLALTHWPDVECASSEWTAMLIFGIAGLCFYSFGFLALVTYQCIRAPRAFVEWPQFKVKYRFMLGKFQPDKWWYTVVGLVQALLLNIISTLSANSYFQLYLTIVLFGIFTALQAVFWPWKFHEINVIDMVCKTCVLLILVLGTSCITGNTEDLEKSMETFKWLMMLFSCCPLAYIALVVVRTVYASCFTNKVARDIAFTQNFHNIILLSGHRNNRELHEFVSTLPDRDYRVCQSFVDVMIAHMFHWQPGPRLDQQRLIPSTSHYVVASNQRLFKKLSVLSSQGYAVGKAFQERELLLKLALDLSRATRANRTSGHSGSRPSLNGALKKSMSSNSLSQELDEQLVGTHELVGLLGVREDAELSCEDFVKVVSPICDSLDAGEVEEVFALIDIDQSGAVSVGEFVTLLDGVVASAAVNEHAYSGMLGMVVDNPELFLRCSFSCWVQTARELKTRRLRTQKKLRQYEIKDKFCSDMTAEEKAHMLLRRWYRHRKARKLREKQEAAEQSLAVFTNGCDLIDDEVKEENPIMSSSRALPTVSSDGLRPLGVSNDQFAPRTGSRPDYPPMVPYVGAI